MESVFKGRARARARVSLIHFFFARCFAVAAAIFLLLTADGRHAHVVDHPAPLEIRLGGHVDTTTLAQRPNDNASSSSEVIDDDERWLMVKTRGNQFVVGDRPFYVNGFNAYWLMILAVDPSTRGKVTEVFQQAAAVGLTVCRSWAFNDGGWRALQKSPSVYDEDVFKALDFVVSEARKYRIRLILSLINNWDGYGGKAQYVKWARDAGLNNLTSDDDFFSDLTVKGYFKSHVTTMVTRVNTYTSVTYKDDPTIMAWELINEPRCASDPTGNTLQAWIQEMAFHVKSVDPDHLLEVGAEGFYGPSSPAQLPANPNAYAGQVGADFVRNHRVLGVDFASVHIYPDTWMPAGATVDAKLEFVRSWMQAHIADAEGALGGMPVVFTEFGASINGGGGGGFNATTRDQLIQAVYGQLLVSTRRGGAGAGALLWQVFPEGTDYMDDGYGVVLPRAAATARIMSAHSRELAVFNSRCAWSCHWGCSRRREQQEPGGGF